MSARLQVDPAALRDAAARVMARCDELARVSSDPHHIERLYLTPEHTRANAIAATWMREVGLTVRQDAVGNLVGRLEAGPVGGPVQTDAPAIVLGSHLDTVPDAGRYDGIVGVLMAIEVVRLLRVPARLASDGPADGSWLSPAPLALDVLAFWDEEGTRFGNALQGSAAVAGLWEPAWLDRADSSGTTLRQAMQDFGLDPDRAAEAARRPDDVVAYLEAHIEQGPELDRRGESLAVVTSIASARRFQVTVTGEARHAGGTPYDMRHDALLGASEVALAVERICAAEHHVVGTVGQLEAFPGAVNVVPGEVLMSVDVRGELDTDRNRVWDAISAELDAVSGRRGLGWSAREIHEAPAVLCAPLLQDVVREGIVSTLGLPGTSADEPARIFSRAGHDAMSLGAITDVGMLFLRNPDGISHHPDEAVGALDVERGIRALAESTLQLLAEPH